MTKKPSRVRVLMMPYQDDDDRDPVFVTQDTALAMKRIDEAMVNSGMYGPIYNLDLHPLLILEFKCPE